MSLRDEKSSELQASEAMREFTVCVLFDWEYTSIHRVKEEKKSMWQSDSPRQASVKGVAELNKGTNCELHILTSSDTP